MPIRFDTLPGLAPAKRTATGFVRCQGFATRVGVFPYRQKDGSVVRELRPPDEVFRADSLETFDMVPVTLEHPPEGLLTSANAAKRSKGTAANPVVSGDMVRIDLMLTDAEAIAAAEGGIQQLSCGYDCDIDVTPGVWRGQRYDQIQRNIKGNHIALVKSGRAGSEARIRLDSLDGAAESCDESLPVDAPVVAEVKKMKTIRLDNKDIEVSDEVFAHLEALQARFDALSGEVTGLRTKADPANIAKSARAHAKLLADARSVFGEKDAQRFDSVDSAVEIQKAIVGKLRPALRLDGKSDLYVAEMCNVVMDARAEAGASRQALTETTAARTETARVDAAPKSPIVEAQARREERALNGKG